MRPVLNLILLSVVSVALFEPKVAFADDFYIDDGGLALTTVRDRDPASVKATKWVVRLYPAGCPASGPGEWGAIVGPSAQDVMRRLAELQEQERATTGQGLGGMFTFTTYMNPLGPIAVVRRIPEHRSNGLLRAIEHLAKLRRKWRQLSAMLTDAPPPRSSGSFFRDYTRALADAEKKLSELERSVSQTVSVPESDIVNAIESMGLASIEALQSRAENSLALSVDPGEGHGWASSYREHGVPDSDGASGKVSGYEYAVETRSITGGFLNYTRTEHRPNQVDDVETGAVPLVNINIQRISITQNYDRLVEAPNERWVHVYAEGGWDESNTSWDHPPNNPWHRHLGDYIFSFVSQEEGLAFMTSLGWRAPVGRAGSALRAESGPARSGSGVVAKPAVPRVGESPPSEPADALRGVSESDRPGEVDGASLAGMGVMSNPTGAEANALKKAGGKGAVVGRVTLAGSAYRANIRPGDVVVGVDGKRIDKGEQLSRAIYAVRATSFTVEIIREGRRYSTVVSRVRPEAMDPLIPALAERSEPAVACKQWDITGNWTINQSNGFTVQLAVIQTGQTLSGSDLIVGGTKGVVTGTVTGADVSFKMSNGGPYLATVVTGRMINGVTGYQGTPTATFTGVGNARCDAK